LKAGKKLAVGRATLKSIEPAPLMGKCREKLFEGRVQTRAAMVFRNNIVAFR